MSEGDMISGQHRQTGGGNSGFALLDGGREILLDLGDDAAYIHTLRGVPSALRGFV